MSQPLGRPSGGASAIPRSWSPASLRREAFSKAWETQSVYDSQIDPADGETLFSPLHWDTHAVLRVFAKAGI